MKIQLPPLLTVTRRNMHVVQMLAICFLPCYESASRRFIKLKVNLIILLNVGFQLNTFH